MVKLVLITASALVLAGTGIAEAGPGPRHHRQHHQGHHHGLRLAIVAAPLLFAPRYVYPAPVYYVPPPQPVYIEQPQPSLQAYWYYCPQYRAYYPQVQNCPGPWQRVAPLPPPG